MYNQTIGTTTEICLTESTTGAFCAEKQIISEKTFLYFDLFIYLLIAIMPLIMIAIFKRKK